MSLVSQAIAVTVYELLKGATWAQDWVVKQPIDPIIEVLKTDGPQRPMLAVYVESAKFHIDGRASSGTDADLEVKIFVYVAPGRMTLTADTYEFSMDSKQAGLTLDIAGRQVDAAFHRDNQWTRIWNKFVAKISSRDVHYMLVEVENGVKIPTMEICYKIQASPDPKFYLTELPAYWAMLDTALRDGGAESVKLADLFKSQIVGGEDLPDYQALMQNFGLSQEGLDATGLGPQNMDSVDVNGNSPLLQAINWFASSALWPPAEGIEFRGFSYSGGATVYGEIFIPGDGDLRANIATAVPTAIGGLTLAAFLGGSASSAPPLAQGGVTVEGAFAAFIGTLPADAVGTLLTAVSLAGTSGSASAGISGDMTRAISFAGGSSSGTAVASGSIERSLGLYGAAASALAAAVAAITLEGQQNLDGSSGSTAASASGLLTAIALLSGSSTSTAAGATGDTVRTASLQGSGTGSATATGDAVRSLSLSGSVSTAPTTTGTMQFGLTGSITTAAATATATMQKGFSGSSTSTAASATGTMQKALSGSSTSTAATATGAMTKSGTGVAFGSISNTTYASRSGLTVTAPTGIANGDVLIAHILWSGAVGVMTGPVQSGWVQVGTTQTRTDGASFSLNSAIFKKVAASESGDYGFNLSASAATQGVIARYTGANGNVNASNYTGSNGDGSNTATNTGVTTTVNGCMLLFAEYDWGDNTNDTLPPTGMTERLDTLLMYWADQVQATAGATGVKSHTANVNSGNPRATWVIALEPA